MTGRPHIGRPIGNVEIFLSGFDMQLVPLGSPGELHIGGVGVGRGYLDRSDLTAEKFIPQQFAREPGSRAYKTGDLVRCLADRNIEFLNRIDRQVKIRGFRIEPGEIESAIARCPSVRDAVVRTYDDSLGERRLVAYVTANDGLGSEGIDRLRSRLNEQLPSYMVPSIIIPLDALPVTRNGKLDLDRLPAPGTSHVISRAAFVAPRTRVEETIASIWCDVLGLEKVGINDNFFDLGGHSLLLAQVHEKLREVLSNDLSILDLFTFPSINSLAKYICNERLDSHEEHGGDRALKEKAAMRKLKESFERTRAK